MAMDFMIRAFHIVLGAYGFWLPNDPQDSWSQYLQSLDLLRLGGARKVDSRRLVTVDPHARSARLAAKESLRYPAVCFTGRQAQAIGEGFRHAIAESGYVIYACSILPQHAQRGPGQAPD